MQFGAIQTFDPQTMRGVLVTWAGLKLSYSYTQGQNLMRADGSDTHPEFTGRHLQPLRFALKHPQPGDIVIVEIVANQVARWAYMSHYQDLTDRQLQLVRTATN
jgi:hypothetical protein